MARASSFLPTFLLRASYDLQGADETFCVPFGEAWYTASTSMTETTMCGKGLHKMTPGNTAPDGRCRKCSRIYHRAYYYKRYKLTTVSLLLDLINAIEHGTANDVRIATAAARKRLVELRRYDADSQSASEEGPQEATEQE